VGSRQGAFKNPKSKLARLPKINLSRKERKLKRGVDLFHSREFKQGGKQGGVRLWERRDRGK